MLLKIICGIFSILFSLTFFILWYVMRITVFVLMTVLGILRSVINPLWPKIKEDEC
jgi:hypothetical protein